MATRTQPAEALRSNARTTAHGAFLLQRAFVVLQAGLSLVLLVAAGLFAQSLNKAENVDMKLDATNRYIAHINPQAAGYKNTEVEPLYQPFVDRFHAISGVLKVGLAYTPIEANDWGSNVKVQGEPDLNKRSSWVKGTRSTSTPRALTSSWAAVSRRRTRVMRGPSPSSIKSSSSSSSATATP